MYSIFVQYMQCRKNGRHEMWKWYVLSILIRNHVTYVFHISIHLLPLYPLYCVF